MSSQLPFDFVTIRERQRSSAGSVESAPYSSAGPLQHVREAVDDDSALRLLDDVIESNDSISGAASAPDLDLLHRALLMRAEVYVRKRNLIRAKNDAQRAIISKPKHVYAYGLLSDIEIKREQLGRAEVALRLGLLLDPNHADLRRKLADIRSKDPVHPDVSHHAGTDDVVRKKLNQAGLDLKPPYPPLIEAIMTGNLWMLKGMWHQESMRDFKYGCLKNPLMHFPIFGRKRMTPVNAATAVETKAKILVSYKSIIDFLYDRGVRLDERDHCGYTAVMHAAGYPPEPDLLDYLLTKGADPDIRSVFGAVALMDATMYQHANEVDILMKHEANPYIVDNDDISPIKFAENHRQVLAAYHRHLYPAMPARICARCPGAGTKRCSKCRVVFYCSKKCQTEDWKSHKPRCTVLSQSHKRVAIVDNGKYTVGIRDFSSTLLRNHLNKDIPDAKPQPLKVRVGKLIDAYNDEYKRNGNMLMKIQVAIDGPIDAKRGAVPILNRDAALAVYNESRSFTCFLDPRALDGPELISIIEHKGYAGKGYFWGFMESDRPELTVITDPLHRAQPW